MKTKKLFSTMLGLALIISLNTNAQVTTDFDKTVDFTKFKTYTFKGWVKNSDQVFNDLDKKRVTDAFEKELKSRGLIIDNSNPDMAVTLYVVIENKTATTAYTSYNGGMGYGGGFGYGMGMGMGMGSSTTNVSEEDYQVGTSVIDFYDEVSKKLIWQGTLNATVTEKPNKRDKTIPKNVAKLMKKYPVKPIKK